MLRRLRNVCVAVVFVLIVDGCIYRDPHVALPHGYNIGAISSGSPCELYYVADDDPQQFSTWSGMQALVDGESMAYYVRNDTGELLEFESQSKWKAAMLDRNADPTAIAATLDNVTRFKTDDRHLIGVCADGYFLLTYATHDLAAR